MKTFAASNKTLLSNAALGVVGVALVSTMVVRASSAAFTGSTSNDGNTWDAGTVTMVNNKTSALFTAPTMRPGDGGTNCIDVTYTGSIMPGEAIKIHGLVGGSDGGGGTGLTATLADNLNVVVTMHAATETCATKTTTGTYTVYSGALDGILSGYTSGKNTTWLPTATNQARAFTLDYTLPSGTGDDAQGDGATANFVWEANSL